MNDFPSNENNDRIKNLNLLSAKDLKALVESGSDLAREISLESLLQNILQTAGRLTDSPDTSIILRSEHEQALYVAAATGNEAEWLLSTYGFNSEKQIPIYGSKHGSHGSKAGEVYDTGKSLRENVVKDHYRKVDEDMKKTTKSIICVQLSVGKTGLGVMQVLNKTSGDYTKRDQVVLEYLADQASVAIRNAQFMESLLAHSGLYTLCRKTEEMLTWMDELKREAHSEILSILFADMRGFTQLIQSLTDPGLIQERLSEFISMISQEIVDHNGIVNKFMGDGVMALFRGTDCSTQAVKCAFSMVKQFDELKERWNNESNEQLDFLDLGVGIVTDQVILGGIGSSKVRDYTAIGAAVNLSAAFEFEARNGKRILCDQHTYNNSKHIIAKAEGPTNYLLQKPGQAVGIKYKCYHLSTLETAKKVRVFLSHSHEDNEYVRSQLVEPLKNREIHTWYSADDIPKGALWTAELRQAISQCNWMIVVVSQNSANSRWVKREIDLAVAAGHLEGRIIPIIIDKTNLNEVNEFLSSMQAINIQNHEDMVDILSQHFSTS